MVRDLTSLTTLQKSQSLTEPTVDQNNRKNLTAIWKEIPLALTTSADPTSLVLDSLKGFYNLEMSNLEAKKDANLLGIRRTCIMLMDSILENVKDRAKAIAEEWKPKLDELDADANHGNYLEAHAFLQLVDTFGINSDFDQEGLIKLALS
nr:FRIGIDA-like protein 3 [Ipomoea batatas]